MATVTLTVRLPPLSADLFHLGAPILQDSPTESVQYFDRFIDNCCTGLDFSFCLVAGLHSKSRQVGDA